MRVLLLEGESDSFFAKDIQERYSTKELVAMAEKHLEEGKGSCDFYQQDDYHEDEYSAWYGSLKLFQFKDVDPAFIDFLNWHDLLQDYDQTKHTEFIVLD